MNKHELTALAERVEAAEKRRNEARWPYLIAPCWFAFVCWADDLSGAFYSAVGMLGAIVFCLYEVGRKAEIDARLAALRSQAQGEGK